MDASPTLCPSDEELRLLCQGKADSVSTDRFLQHLDGCPLCPDRADAIWRQSLAPFPPGKAALASKDPTPLLQNAPGLEKLLARADLERIGITFLPRSTNPLCLGRLGDYDLHRVIGTGGMGIVFQVTLSNDRDDQPLALKTLKLGPATSLASRERFLREARALQAVRHPGLVPVLATGEDAGIPFFVMPLLVGHNFERLIAREAPLLLDKAIDLARQSVEALAAAHAAGLVHRDIKPSNLWLEPPTTAQPFGRVRLLEFGLAQIEAEEATLTSTGVALGTPAYLSPEQAEGTGRIGPASDLFSFGCVLYEMLVGSRVFPGTTAMEIFRNIAAFRIAPPSRYRPDLPPRLDQLVMRMLAHQPVKRPPSAEALLHDLKHPRLLDRPLLTRRRLLASAATAAAGLGGYATWRATRPAPLPLFQPSQLFPVRDATTFCMVPSWMPDHRGPCVAWATPSGTLFRQALGSEPPELIGESRAPVQRLTFGINTLGVCSPRGIARFLTFGRKDRVFWSAPPLDLPEIPEKLVDFAFNPAMNRYLAAVGQTIRIWDINGGQVDIYSPRCRSPITSLVPCPVSLDKGRHFAVTMQDGTLGFLNDNNLLMYQESLMETPMDFRLAIREDSVEAAVWDGAGHLSIWQAENFTHRSRKMAPRFPLDADESDFATPESPCRPLAAIYLVAGNNLVLMGEAFGRRHLWLVETGRGRVIGRLAADNPLEFSVSERTLWVLEEGGRLLKFDTSPLVQA